MNYLWQELAGVGVAWNLALEWPGSDFGRGPNRANQLLSQLRVRRWREFRWRLCRREAGDTAATVTPPNRLRGDSFGLNRSRTLRPFSTQTSVFIILFFIFPCARRRDFKNNVLQHIQLRAQAVRQRQSKRPKQDGNLWVEGHAGQSEAWREAETAH